jgi:peroxiredoxin Q/BCP
LSSARASPTLVVTKSEERDRMKNLLKRLLGRTDSPPRMLEVGQPAPDFRAEAHDGRMVSLAGQRGKKVVLWFYPKADTPGCTIEGKAFCQGYPDFQRRGVEVFGVSFDDRAANEAFAGKFGFPYPLLCDTDRSIGLAYGACDSRSAKHARRISYVIDENGRIAHAFAKVDPDSHIPELLEKYL